VRAADVELPRERESPVIYTRAEREIMRESFVTSAGSLGLNALKTLRVITNLYWVPLPLGEE
jgi:hypothetical protein